MSRASGIGYTLFVKVVGCRKLKSSDSNGLSDPYCKLTVGKQKNKTKTKKKTLNPRYNEIFKFDNVDSSDSLFIETMDWDRLGGDDFLGEVRVHFSGLIPEKTKEEWYPLKGRTEKDCVTGDVHILLHLTSDMAANPTLQPSAGEGHGRLSVEVLAARNLQIKDRIDTYVIVSLEDEKYKTNIVEKDINPAWDDEVFFFETEKDKCELLAQLWDWNNIGFDSFMGQVVVPIGTVADGKSHDQWYKLMPRKKENVSGELRLRIQYLSASQAQKNVIVAQKYYDMLLKDIMAPDFVFISTLCNVYESNEVSRTVINLFNAEGQVLALINQFLYRELKKTGQETTLFRTDSMTTRAIVNYLKLTATGYLQDVFGPFLRDMKSYATGYEIDPEKTKPEEINGNMERLRTACQTFFDAIITSVDKCPIKVRQMLGYLRKMVAQVFPDSQLKAIGGFVFLRFMCPSLIAPEGFGLLKAPPEKDSRRTLCLIAKVLQNTANGVPFKEDYMKGLNDFIEYNKMRCIGYYDDLSTVPGDAPTISLLSSDNSTNEEGEKHKDMGIIVQQISLNHQRIEKEFPNDLRIVNNPIKLEENKKRWEDIKQILSF